MRPDKGSINLLMIFCALLVSTSFTVGEHIADALSPGFLTFLRFVIAFLILLPIVKRKHDLRVTVRSLIRYGLISGSLVIFFFCMFISLKYTTAFNTSVLFTLVPLLAGLYSAIITAERLPKKQLAALLVAFVGALLVIVRGNLLIIFEIVWNKGDLVFVGGCLAMGFYTPLVKLLHRDEPMEVMTFWVLGTGAFWLLPVTVIELNSLNLSAVSIDTWGWVLYLALFTTVISFYLTQFAIPYIGPTRVMAYSYLYPPLVLLIDLVIGRGLPGISVVPGILIILLGMVVLMRSAE